MSKLEATLIVSVPSFFLNIVLHNFTRVTTKKKKFLVLGTLSFSGAQPAKPPEIV